MLKAALANAQTEMDDAGRNLRSVSNSFTASDADKQSAASRYTSAMDRVRVLRQMIGSDVGLPEEPQPLNTRSGSTPELQSLNAQAMAALAKATTPEQKRAVMERYQALLKRLPAAPK